MFRLKLIFLRSVSLNEKNREGVSDYKIIATNLYVRVRMLTVIVRLWDIRRITTMDLYPMNWL